MATGTRRRSKAQREADEAARQERAAEEERQRRVTWAVTYGAPIMILDGWDPTSGEWSATSPIGRILAFVSNGAHLGPAAELAGVRRISNLYSKGAEYYGEIVEDRAELEPDQRVFADLYRQISMAENLLEVNTVSGVKQRLRGDPELSLKFLSRRFPNRWREQNAFYYQEERDATDAAVSKAITDPNVALHLAKVAEAIESQRTPDEV